MKELYALIEKVNSTISKTEEISKLKGETFNIFFLLKVERLENNTHSNFISELLNSEGSHQLGNVFLNKFIDILNKYSSKRIEKENFSTHTEYHTQNYGRIDIVLETENTFIAIENKIYAGDQDKQIERYHNYAKSTGKKFQIFYLTLYGNEASEISRNKLITEQDYYTLSYKDDIRNWLNECIKEASEFPIIRETIKQYLILIKKLTGQLTNQKMEKELFEIILSNYEAAQKIESNFKKARRTFGDIIRKEVFKTLEKNQFVKQNFELKIGDSVENKTPHMQIWIRLKENLNNNRLIGIESFSGEGNNNGKLFIGIIDYSHSEEILETLSDNNYMNKWWVHFHQFTKFENLDICFNDSKLLSILATDKEKQNKIIEHISSECISFLEKNIESYRKIITVPNFG